MATINGTTGNDSLAGTAGDDTLNGLGGKDTLVGSGGTDFYDGGAGSDTLDFRATAAGVTVSFSDGTVSGGFSGTFANIERVLGGNGADVIIGAAGGQNLSGRSGSDRLAGAAGVDTLWGGSGGDSFVFAETGTANADSVSDFASGSDVIVLDASVMTALGAGGNFSAGDARFVANSSGTAQDAGDRVIYETDTRQIWYDADGNGAGARQLIATLQSGATLVATDIAVENGAQSGMLLQGGSGDDSLTGGPGNDTITGAEGWDTLDGGAGDDSLDGGAHQDLLRGGDGSDTLIGGDGPFVSWSHYIDWLYGGSGDDWLDGGLGQDYIFGEDGNDVLFGGDFDTLDGGAGADTMHGGEGRTTFIVTEGDVIVDHGGIDEVYSDISWTLSAGIERLYLTGTAAIDGWGNASNNSINGNDAANYLFVGSGEDWASGGGGNDTIESAAPVGDEDGDMFVGGEGVDTLTLAGQMLSAVVIDLQGADDFGASMTGGGSGGSSQAFLSGIENVIADAYDDRLSGSDVANVLDGRGGNDTLEGAAGNDTLIGGSGADTFLFLQPAGAINADRITDFTSGQDRLQLDLPDASLGTPGAFAAGDQRFHAGPGATSGHDATDRIIYDTTTGNLYLDADGSGGGAAELIATLQGAPTLAATDISTASRAQQGGDGDDSMVGSADPDSMAGGGGDDTLIGNDGNDTLEGGAGHDSLTGNLGADSLTGGEGNDTLEGLWGRRDDYEWEEDWDWMNNQPLPGGDTLDGGLGDDHYYLGRNDTIIDTGGVDTVHAEHDYTLQAGLENLLYAPYPDSDGEGLFVQFGGNELDNFIEITHLWESSSSVLDGGAGNDTLWGAGDTSTFRFSLALDDYGHDELHGTRIDFADAQSAIVVDLMAGTMAGGGTGGSGSATLFGIYDVYGGEFDDHIIGGDSGGGWGYPQLVGGGGNDTLEGGTGLTDLWGGEGDDRLISHSHDSMQGGEGADTFVFSRVPAAPDPFYSYYGAIDDFATGIDAIHLDAAFHSGIGSSGRFTAGDERFYAAAGATEGHDATDRVIHDTSTGVLYYDPDGDGSAAASIIVGLGAGTALVASDIGVERDSTDLVLVGTQGNDSLAGGGGSDTIDGGGGDDSLSGGDGADSIRGGDGNDTLDGGADPDSMDGGSGDDTYYVTADDQLVDAGGHDLVLAVDNWTLGEDFEDLTVTSSGNPYGYVSGFGNELANVVRANATTNVSLSGYGGNDTLYGGPAAHATLRGGNGDDFLNGTNGGDSISGDAGNDSIVAGAGDDVIDMFGSAFDGNYGQDTVDGGTGADQLDFSDDWAAKSGVTVDLAAGSATGGGPAAGGRVTFTGIERIFGTPFADDISGDSGANELFGSNGNDTIAGGAGNDTLFGDWSLPEYGTLGSDTFVFAHYGEAHADRITDFRSSYDKIALDASVFTAIGASGNFSSGDGRFAANSSGTAQDADDRIIFDTSTARLYYDADGSGAAASQHFATTTIFYGVPAATDFVVVGTAPETGQLINGTSGNDTLSGTSGDDTISGLGGNDFFLAGSTGGADVIDGGEGRDSIEFKAAATSAIVVNFNAGTIGGGSSGGSISFSGIERVVAGNFDDSMSGTVGSQTLAGQAGADTLTGGAGNDTLWGGTGNDAFVFNGMGAANADRISDFTAGQDKVQLEDGAFTAIGATGNFAAGDGRFWAAAGASAGHDVNDRVIYNTSTGELYYDADGSGSGAAQLVATLSTIPNISATDIAVI